VSGASVLHEPAQPGGDQPADGLRQSVRRAARADGRGDRPRPGAALRHRHRAWHVLPALARPARCQVRSVGRNVLLL